MEFFIITILAIYFTGVIIGWIYGYKVSVFKTKHKLYKNSIEEQVFYVNSVFLPFFFSWYQAIEYIKMYNKLKN